MLTIHLSTSKKNQSFRGPGWAPNPQPSELGPSFQVVTNWTLFQQIWGSPEFFMQPMLLAINAISPIGPHFCKEWVNWPEIAKSWMQH